MGKITSGCIRIIGKFGLCALLVVAVAQAAEAQSRSSAGVGTGADVISSAVPEAGNIFDLHDDIKQLLDDVTACAGDNMLPDGKGSCRGSKEPDVDFSVKDQVTVQNPYPNQDSSSKITYSLTGEVEEGYIDVDAGKTSCSLNWTDLKVKTEIIPHGDSVKAYEAGKVEADEKCNGEIRTCNDGTLSGTHTFNRCEVKEKEACVMNWTDLKVKEQVVPHGESIVAYKNGKVTGSYKCISETRTCDDGKLSGSFTYNNCVIEAPKNCTMSWADLKVKEQLVLHGDSVKAYEDAKVPAGDKCNGEIRTCNDGSLSGKFLFNQCQVDFSVIEEKK